MGARTLLPLLSLTLSVPVAAQVGEHEPYSHGLRIGIFPAHFQAGVSQSHFGSSARAELDLMPGLSVDAAGRLGWANVAGEKDPTSYLVSAGLTWTFVDVEEKEPLSGTVYPEDTPAMRGTGAGVDSDLELPVNQRMGGPRMTLPEKDRSLIAPMRNVQGLRLGYARVQAVQEVRPGAGRVVNASHLAYLGYTWGTHWNLGPADAGGERELGHKRFYLDLLGTVKELTERDDVGDIEEPTPRKFLALGVRVGLAGAIDALLASAEGVGLGYQLELGALPGESGLEGYLLIALGLELDVRTRRLPPSHTSANASAP